MAEKVTLAMIANECHLSVGTVSRALNDRSDISAETKELVVRTAQKLGYRKSGHADFAPLRLAAVYCRERADFYREVTAGIEKAQEELGPRRVHVDQLQTESLDQAAQSELLAQIHPEDYDGLLINSAGVETDNYINRVIEQGIPVATFNTDAPSSHRLFFVGCNAHTAGQIGAYLLGKLVGGEGKVILFGSVLGKTVWVDRLSSAFAVMRQEFPGIEVVPVFFDPSSPLDTAQSVERCLNENYDLAGIFPINNARTCEVIQLLQEQRRQHVRVVGFDITQETREGILNGFCDALLFQDPFRQGYLSVIHMVKYLTQGILPSTEEVSITPRIIMKYNIDSY